jgi:hypothetical protein
MIALNIALMAAIAVAVVAPLAWASRLFGAEPEADAATS